MGSVLSPGTSVSGLASRFWSKVCIAPFGCWEWTAGKVSRGYGCIGYRGRVINAHRVSWALTFGDPGEAHVLHLCDNRGCVNPAHLFLGTHTDNMADMVCKGRQRRGATAGMPRSVNDDLVSLLLGEGLTHRETGAVLGVSQTTIHRSKERTKSKALRMLRNG